MGSDTAKSRLEDAVRDAMYADGLSASDVRGVVEAAISYHHDREETKPHHHVALYDDDEKLQDACAKCGRDIRNEVHLRASA